MTELAVIPRLPPPKPAARKQFSGARLAFILVGALVGAALGYAGAKFGTQLLVPVPGPKAWKLVTLAGLPLFWLVAVGFHEFGHLVGGWAAGGKFLLYVVGPLMWRRAPSGVAFVWNRNVNLAGGLAACLPLDPARVTPRRTALMIAGGPLFSLVLAVACLWLAALLGTATASLGTALAQHAAIATALLSVLIFLVTAFPGTAGGFKSDGRRFFELLRGDARSEQEKAMLALTTSALGGVRPADYDPELVRQALSLRDRSLFDLYAHLTAFHHAVDLGRLGEAQAALDYVIAAEEKLAPFVRDTARCDYAWLLARHAGDAVAARAWLDSAGALAFDPATRLRAEAAVLLAEGRKQEAAAKAGEGLHALEHKSLSPVRNQFAFELLEEIRRQAAA